MMALSLYLAGTFLVIGAGFSVLAALGVLRFPDLYTRLHAAAKAGPVGASFVLLAIAVSSFDAPIILRALAGILFILLTAPIAAHLLARAAYSSGIPLSTLTKINDLGNERDT